MRFEVLWDRSNPDVCACRLAATVNGRPFLHTIRLPLFGPKPWPPDPNSRDDAAYWEYVEGRLLEGLQLDCLRTFGAGRLGPGPGGTHLWVAPP